MKGYPTSYRGMFQQAGDDVPVITAVEIPLIQRDYAQGRPDPRASDIRRTFLDALHHALADGDPIGLDFVYGEVNSGTFEPLDGQQRLTTLFLLHWYLAFRSGHLDASQPWTDFTYATRPSARLFCERIVENPPPAESPRLPSAWIKDQSWYLHLWRFDPTIRAMLVMLDAIAERFGEDDAEVAWERLTDEDNPAVWFQLLPIDEMGSAEDLYIKMNSRGKPLTAFEEFKAHFGQIIAHSGRAEDFGHKIDGAWTDLVWHYRGDNDIVDDEFMRYFDFVLEICEWREGKLRSGEPVRLERRAQSLLGEDNPRHAEHLAFFFDALDRWVAEPGIAATFEALFTASAPEPGKVRLFGAPTANLFAFCCKRYGDTRGDTRVYSLTDTLLLYATLIHRIDGTEDVTRRLRQLRNLNEASQFEMRVQNMPKLIAEVGKFMHSGALDDLATFNQNQVADEQRKREFLDEHPEAEPAIQRLEDHPILRGTLASFELDAATIGGRASGVRGRLRSAALAFAHRGALGSGRVPAATDRDRNRFRFGSSKTEGVWRTLLVDRGDRASLAPTRTVLTKLLDRLAASHDPIEAQLEAIVESFLAERLAEGALDWRYYLVRYPCMREGNSGHLLRRRTRARLRADDAPEDRSAQLVPRPVPVRHLAASADPRPRSRTPGSSATRPTNVGCVWSAARSGCGACREGSRCKRRLPSSTGRSWSPWVNGTASSGRKRTGCSKSPSAIAKAVSSTRKIASRRLPRCSGTSSPRACNAIALRLRGPDLRDQALSDRCV